MTNFFLIGHLLKPNILSVDVKVTDRWELNGSGEAGEIFWEMLRRRGLIAFLWTWFIAKGSYGCPDQQGIVVGCDTNASGYGVSHGMNYIIPQVRQEGIPLMRPLYYLRSLFPHEIDKKNFQNFVLPQHNMWATAQD